MVRFHSNPCNRNGPGDGAICQPPAYDSPLRVAPLENEEHLVTLPVWCACGKIVKFGNENRCEDCYAVDQARFTGDSQHVDVPLFTAREEAEHDRRAAEIRQALSGCKHGV